MMKQRRFFPGRRIWIPAVLIGIILLCGYGLWTDVSLHYQVEQMKQELKEFEPDFAELFVDQLSSAEESTREASSQEKQWFQQNISKFRKLQTQNQDVLGWIHLYNTRISYPVLESKNNADYINKDVYGKKSAAGSIFLDYRCERRLDSFSTILYGHNMKSGAMFAGVKHYGKQEFLDQHLQGILLTEKSLYRIEIFAYLLIDSNSQLYMPVQVSNQEKQGYLDLLKQESLIYKERNITIKDRILLLSTCNSIRETARSVVAAKIVELVL